MRDNKPKFDSNDQEMLANQLKIGEIVYIPVVDLVSCGFIIEELKIKKLLPPSGNPSGFPKLHWSYGNISNYNQMKEKFGGMRKMYYVNSVFRTPEECLPKLEEFRLSQIESSNSEKHKWIDQIENLEKILSELRVESKEAIRFQNKKLALLHQLDLKDQFDKKFQTEF